MREFKTCTVTYKGSDFKCDYLIQNNKVEIVGVNEVWYEYLKEDIILLLEEQIKISKFTYTQELTHV